MSWRARSRLPVTFSPELWEDGYREFWMRWLSGRRAQALLMLGDWRQP